jgi:Kdo2-lipid IVA lauroyltransferase/acyltransferase
MTEVRWRHRVEYALARAVEATVRALPSGGADRLGTGLGGVLHAMRIRRKVVENNLRIAFPHLPAERISELALSAYRHLGREAVAMMRLATSSPEEIRTATTTVGWDELASAHADGRGVILATGHHGNWEVAAAAVAARGLPIAAVVKRIHNPLVHGRLDAGRRALGVETIDFHDAPRRVPRILRSGGIVGMVADQDARRSGIFVPFFGRPASTHRGPALFALRLEAPLFACIARRLPGAGPRYEVRGDRVAMAPSGDLETDVRELTALLALRLQGEIEAAPEQYFWFHRRWKSSPPEEHHRPGPGTSTGEPNERTSAT